MTEVSILIFNARKQNVMRKLKKEYHLEFERRVQYVLNILDQDSISKEALALIAADVSKYETLHNKGY